MPSLVEIGHVVLEVYKQTREGQTENTGDKKSSVEI